MIEVTIHAQELYNERENRFFDISESVTVHLEHSLLAISKWEARFQKPFLDKTKKTKKEAYYYIYCMCLDENVPEETIYGISDNDLKRVLEYIDSQQSGTTIKHTDQNRSVNREIVTSELVYYWMNESNIPKECEVWHFSRLMNLIEITAIKRQPDKKMTKRQTGAQNKALNAARRAKFGSRG